METTHLCGVCACLQQQPEVGSRQLVVLDSLTQTSLVVLDQTTIQHHFQPPWEREERKGGGGEGRRLPYRPR